MVLLPVPPPSSTLQLPIPSAAIAGAATLQVPRQRLMPLAGHEAGRPRPTDKPYVAQMV